MTREGQMPIRFNWVKDREHALRIGIQHGYDDVGDKGMTFEVKTKSGELVLEGFAGNKNWEWFQSSSLESNELIITVKDRDTKFSGRFPGNYGRLKVNLIKL